MAAQAQKPPSDSTAPTSRIGNLFRELRVLRHWQATGELQVRRDGVLTRIVIIHGLPVFAHGGESLGRQLLRQQRITLKQYIAIADEVVREPADEEDRAFGQVVVRLGLLTVDEMCTQLTELVRDRIVDCMCGDDPTSNFVTKAKPTVLVEEFAPPLERLFLQAACAMEPRVLERVLELGEERYPRLVESAERLATAFGLSDEETLFVAGIDGSRSTHTLIGVPLADGSDPTAILATLVLAASAELLPHPTSARPGPPSVLVASLTLGAELADLGPPQAMAAAAFERGKDHIRKFAFRRAMSDFARAVKLAPENVVYAVYGKWAEFRSVGGTATSRVAKELRNLAEEAIARNEKFGFGYYVLGHIALLNDDEATARTLFCRGTSLEDDRRGSDGRAPRIVNIRVPREREDRAE